MPAEQFLARSDRAGHGVDVHVSRSGEPVIRPRTLVTTPALLVVVVLLLVPGWARAVDFKLKLPTGLQEDAAEIPDDNPISPEKIALGKKFYWDKRWSASKTVACVSCHRPDHGWSDPRTFSTDFAGKPTPRHAPTIVNRLFSDRQHWTGQRASLEEQAGLDVNKTDEKVVEHLGTIPAYRHEFRAVFGRDLDPDGVAQAIATYVRTIVSGNSPYDRVQAGDQSAMSVAAQRGLRLFEGKAMCVRCHAGFNFTGEGYRNIGVGMNKPNPDLGPLHDHQGRRGQGGVQDPDAQGCSQARAVHARRQRADARRCGRVLQPGGREEPVALVGYETPRAHRSGAGRSRRVHEGSHGPDRPRSEPAAPPPGVER